MKITLLALMIFFAPALRADESGPGNGTDYVKVLFAEAQFDLARLLASVDDSGVNTLSINEAFKSWLLSPSEEGVSRWQRLKYFERAMELRYQQEPCTDQSQKPASICFFEDPRTGPYVMVSLLENKMTTREQATAMLVHEAGHFVGERDHLFLDRLGIELVSALRLPRLLIADAESTEISTNPFQGKEECDRGVSTQAKTLRKEALLDLELQCSARGVKCDASKAQMIYRGEPHFQEGVGYDMKVVCRARAVLHL